MEFECSFDGADHHGRRAAIIHLHTVLARVLLSGAAYVLMSSGLEVTLLLLAAVVVGVAAFRLLQLPPLLGYLAVGIAIGPHAFGLVPDTKDTRYLAEFGVVFLMFSIGLEFSLTRLRSMRRLVLGLGGAQVGLTILLTFGAGWFSGSYFGIGLAGAFALGGALAMSSTAIVMKMLAERVQLDTEHGKRIVGVLLFQDLAVVPLLVIVPALGSGGTDLAWTLSVAMAKAAVLLTVLLVGGRRVVRWWFHTVAQRKSHELFTLNMLLVTLGLAWMTEEAGLSLALGAFVAGMLISETEFRHQVEEDIKPFRDVLLGLFFVTIGMLLNVRIVVDNFGWVMLALIGPVGFKFGLIVLLVRVFGATPGTAIRSGLALATAGEFGFVLLGHADRPGVDAAVDAGGAAAAAAQRQDRDAPVLQRMAAQVAGDRADRPDLDRGRQACRDLRVRAQRPASGQDAGTGGHHLRRARRRSRPRAAGRRRRRIRGLRGRGAARDARGGRHQPRVGAGDHLCRHAVVAEDPSPCARAQAGHRGDRANAGRS
jgi:monovalent cation:proton antiporter-2 (CPA2) family protein